MELRAHGDALKAGTALALGTFDARVSIAAAAAAGIPGATGGAKSVPPDQRRLQIELAATGVVARQGTFSARASERRRNARAAQGDAGFRRRGSRRRRIGARRCSRVAQCRGRCRVDVDGRRRHARESRAVGDSARRTGAARSRERSSACRRGAASCRRRQCRARRRSRGTTAASRRAERSPACPLATDREARRGQAPVRLDGDARRRMVACRCAAAQRLGDGASRARRSVLRIRLRRRPRRSRVSRELAPSFPPASPTTRSMRRRRSARNAD